ncbi:hypothetical protein JGS22_013100 [Streptomyces sp. P38-E01]|uniref:Uncharacterized protein n=1 Tax=Streptomyces tardus TaxID=2780544 RepID=A0A949JQT2_9ACTN|nr:hypothetical protein [Streptomyces tardus]MBU7598525.1 hypothetical protein [Streptomyces tardus]
MSDRLDTLLTRRARRRLRRNRTDLAVLLGVVALGLSLGLTFLVAATSSLRGMDDFAASHHREAGHFEPASGKDVPPEGTPGYETTRTADVTGPGSSVLRLGQPRERINRHQIVSGRELRAADELLLNRRYAQAHGIALGDRITAGERRLTVVGYAAAPDLIAVKNSEIVLQPNHERFGVGFVTAETFAHWREAARTTVFWDASVDVARMSGTYEAATVRDVQNNSRVQQAIGDSQGPRDLALLILGIFLVIIFALLAVHHFENRKREAADLEAFDLLGHRRRAMARHLRDPLAPLLVGWTVASAVALAAAGPAMDINAKLYDYPRMSVDLGTWALASLAIGLLLALLNWAAYRMFYPGRPARTVRRRRLPLARLRWLPDAGYRLRLVRGLRNPREPVATVVLLLVVAFLVNFSLSLRVSVDSYLEALEDQTPFSHMYVLPDGSGSEGPARGTDEAGRLSTLYHASGTAQSVFEVPPRSRYFGSTTGPVVTSAFREKYGIGTGDLLTLRSLDGTRVHPLRITGVTDETTSSYVYLPAGGLAAAAEGGGSGGTESGVPVLFTGSAHPQLEGRTQSVAKEEIVSSGRSIVEIINLQIGLLIGLACLLLVLMLLALYRFVLGTQQEFLRVMRLNGHGPRVLVRALFGFTAPAAVLAVVLSQLLAVRVVRWFFDGIMYDFSAYVPVASGLGVPLLTGALLALLMSVFLLHAHKKMRSPS